MCASAASDAHLDAAIYNSDDSPTMGEVSDIVNDDTTVVEDVTCNDNDDNMSDGDDTSNDILNRVGWKVGMAAREDCRFREHFGAPFAIMQIVWDMLVEGLAAHVADMSAECRRLATNSPNLADRAPTPGCCRIFFCCSRAFFCREMPTNP